MTRTSQQRRERIPPARNSNEPGWAFSGFMRTESASMIVAARTRLGGSAAGQPKLRRGGGQTLRRGFRKYTKEPDPSVQGLARWCQGCRLLRKHEENKRSTEASLQSIVLPRRAFRSAREGTSQELHHRDCCIFKGTRCGMRCARQMAFSYAGFPSRAAARSSAETELPISSQTHLCNREGCAVSLPTEE